MSSVTHEAVHNVVLRPQSAIETGHMIESEPTSQNVDFFETHGWEKKA
jgi:hypothetical protein